MSGGLNKVMIIGNLGKDPEMKYTQQGTPITSFSVAVSRTWKGPDGSSQEETEWFRVVAWERLAEQCNEFLRKGRKVFIEGRLKTREWTGQDGQKRFTTEVVATSMILLDPKQGGDYSGGGGGGYREERQAPARQGAGSGAAAGGAGGGAAGGFGHSYDDDADLDVDDIPF
ncbi:MAG TPA: single-stranded DNA-binding protein [Chloroflexia bacterium]|nr:single-stranded DNA-binding protein [Chloroflexia bacterium]